MDQMEIMTRKGSKKGLNDAERLQVAQLLLKAGYTVQLIDQRPEGKTTGAYDQYIKLTGGLLNG